MSSSTLAREDPPAESSGSLDATAESIDSLSTSWVRSKKSGQLFIRVSKHKVFQATNPASFSQDSPCDDRRDLDTFHPTTGIINHHGLIVRKKVDGETMFYFTGHHKTFSKTLPGSGEAVITSSSEILLAAGMAVAKEHVLPVVKMEETVASTVGGKGKTKPRKPMGTTEGSRKSARLRKQMSTVLGDSTAKNATVDMLGKRKRKDETSPEGTENRQGMNQAREVILLPTKKRQRKF